MILQQPALLLADVDGTLVTPEKLLTERAIQAIHALHKSGIAFSFVSGRPPLGMKQLALSIRVQFPYAAFNGGALIMPNLEIWKTRPLSPDVVKKAVDLILQNGLDDAWIYTENNWYIHRPELPRVRVEQSTVQFAPIVIQSHENRSTNVLKVVGLSEDYSHVARCETDLQHSLSGIASAARSQPYYVDVTNPQANKGTVLEDLCTYLKISPSQAITIGDMPSDVLMFKKSGLSIAMGNASDEVKSSADMVTQSNAEEGFAKAVEHVLSKIKWAA